MNLFDTTVVDPVHIPSIDSRKRLAENAFPNARPCGGENLGLVKKAVIPTHRSKNVLEKSNGRIKDGAKPYSL